MPVPAVLVYICDGAGDGTVFVITPELFDRLEGGREAEALWSGDAPAPGVLDRCGVQHGVPHSFDLSRFNIQTVYMTEGS